jgi:hypothetical protein
MNMHQKIIPTSYHDRQEMVNIPYTSVSFNNPLSVSKVFTKTLKSKENKNKNRGKK